MPSHPLTLPSARPNCAQVMMRYVDLAVDMRAGRKVKDALINYRNACQAVNVGSLEEVVRHLLDTASERAERAQREAAAKEQAAGGAAEGDAIAVEDLEAEPSPEEVMLSYVSGERSKDRTDREMVTPWFKFLWETHRQAVQEAAAAGEPQLPLSGEVPRPGGMAGGIRLGSQRPTGLRLRLRLAASFTCSSHPTPGFSLCAGTCWTCCETARAWRRSTRRPPRAPSSSASPTSARLSSGGCATSCATT